MADNVILADGVQPGVTTVVTLFTSPVSGGGTRVIGFTATNPTVTTAKYDLYVVPNGGSADDTNVLVSQKSLAQDASDVPPEIQDHLIPAGGTLAVKVDNATTIAFRGTGINF